MWLQGPPPKGCREEAALIILIIRLLIELLEEEIQERFEFEGKVAQNEWGD